MDASVVLVPQNAVNKRGVSLIKLPQLNQLLAYLGGVFVQE